MVPAKMQAFDGKNLHSRFIMEPVLPRSLEEEEEFKLNSILFTRYERILPKTKFPKAPFQSNVLLCPDRE